MLKEICLLVLTIVVRVECNYCTNACQFSLYFDEEFDVPDNCPKEYGHPYIQCHADYQINYIDQTIDVNIYYAEDMPTGGSLYQLDIFTNFDQSNEQMTSSLHYSCVYVDDCALNFTQHRLKTLLNHQSILLNIKDNLYNLGGSHVKQCYDRENKTIDCINGLCRAEVGTMSNPNDTYSPLPYYRTYCDYYPADDPFKNKTGLLATRTDGLPVEYGIFNHVHFVCNQNLCNNDQNIKYIQQLVDNFNNYSIIIPNGAIKTTTISSLLTISITILLIIKHFFIY